MGSSMSNLLPEELEELETETGFSQQQLKRLFGRFMSLDKSSTGVLSTNELLAIPEIAINPLAPRLAVLLREVNFRDFVRNLAAFNCSNHNSNNDSKRLSLLFRIYDVDDDGFISQEDLQQVLEMLVGECFTARQVESTARRIISEYDLDHDCALSLQEFSKAFSDEDLRDTMTFKMYSDDTAF